MSAARRFLRRLTTALTRRQDAERIGEELEAHLAMQTADNLRAGMLPAEARRAAMLKLGPIESVKAEYRDGQTLPAFDDLARDVRYALRQFRRAPLFTLTAGLSLAMGLGANAAVFTIIERILLRPLPVANPHELVYVADDRAATQPGQRYSYPFYAALADNGILAGITARAGRPLTAEINGQSARVSGELVSGSYFGLLGIATHTGRPLGPDDDRLPAGEAVAVISDAYWRRSFSADPGVPGRTILLNGHPFTIVGIAPAGFGGMDVGAPCEVWIPMAAQRHVGRDLAGDPRTNWLEIFGRLQPGVTAERAATELSAHLRRASQLPGDQAQRRLVLQPGAKGRSAARRDAGAAFGVLMALTALALGLACVNVASLVAVRAAGREKEMAIRLAIGARRGRLTTQLLTEGLLLSVVSGAAGMMAAPWAARLFLAAQPQTMAIDPALGLRVVALTLAASCLAGFAIALPPVFTARKADIRHGFDAASRPGAASRRLAPHDAVIALQIAAALAMLISAALLVQSLRGLKSVNPGFRADNLLLVSLDPGAAGYQGARLQQFWRDTLSLVGQLPGVESASLARTVPLAPGRQRQNWTNAASGLEVELDTNTVGPRYFRTLAIPLRGREFEERDSAAAARVVIVNERLAGMFWPGQDPLGRSIPLPDADRIPAQVVGVVKDVKYQDLRGEAGPMAYRPLLQSRSSDALTLHVRGAGDLDDLVSAIRAQIHQLDASVPLFQITTLEAQLNASFAATRQAALMTALFGVFALLLSGIGVYGVTALAISRRTRDIGIRLALGASSRDIVRSIGRRGIAMVVVGLTLGLFGSLAFSRITGILLFGVTPGDGATISSMTALLALVSLIGFSIPVRRATRMNAVAAIRQE